MNYTQEQLLEVIQTYNNTDRQTIKKNLKILRIKYNFSNADITAELGHKPEKVRGWFSVSNPYVPTFEDALSLAVKYGFDIKEMFDKV